MQTNDAASVMLDVEIKSPVERVWRAITDSDTLSKWMMFKTNNFQPVVGHEFQLKDAPGYDGVIDCKVLEVNEPHQLAYTWQTLGQDDAAHNTVVTWTLTEAQSGITRLQLQQSGFRAEAKQEFAGAKAGWGYMLDALQQVLAE